MSAAFELVYERGGFKLGWDKIKKSGELRSPNLAIVWYDQERGRLRSQSTGTSDVQVGKTKLDEKYSASTGGACSFCAHCGQSVADASKYLLLQALMAYYEEVGQDRVSHDSLKARLKHLTEFVHSANLIGVTCAEVDDRFVRSFRTWSAAQPVCSVNKAGQITSSRARSPATTEESVIALKAALNHAVSMRRIEAALKVTILGRGKVSPDNIERVDLPMIAAMLRYASACPRRATLHSFLVASVTTLARPNAVFDINTSPERQQWREGSHLLRLNPKGRVQTKKRRPDVPVPSILLDWLSETASDPETNGWLVNVRGEPIANVRSAWTSMLKALNLPQDRDHGSYIIRRSMATILRNWDHEAGRTQVSEWDLQAQLGHRGSTTTESYAKPAKTYKSTVQRALEEALEELEKLAPGALHRKNTGAVAPAHALRLVVNQEKPRFSAGL